MRKTSVMAPKFTPKFESPGKLAIASATRNPGILNKDVWHTPFPDASFHGVTFNKVAVIDSTAFGPSALAPRHPFHDLPLLVGHFHNRQT
jgi:hypothetical protein